MLEELKLLYGNTENTDFYFEDKKVAGLSGSYISITTYFINIKHKNFLIRIVNELGNYNMGTVEVNLNQNYIPDFEITTRNHFINLFLRHKSMLKIKCDTSNYKQMLIEIASEARLEKITKENSFEPKIYTIKDKNSQYIKTEYSLQFEDKIGAIEALIDFYKLLIAKI